MRVNTAWCLTGAALLVLYTFWFFAGAQHGRWSPRGGPLVVSQAAMIVFYALAGVLQWRAGHTAQLDAATRRAWLTMTVANVGVIALSSVWLVRAWHGANGTPSEQIDVVSTVIYAVTNAVGILALIRFPASPRLGADRATFWLDAGAVLSAGLLLAWHLLFRAAIATAGGGGVKLIGALVYPAADVLLLFATIALLLRRPLPSSAAALRVFTFTVALSTFADVPMVFDSLSGGLRGASPSDLLYIVVAWLFGVSAYVQCRRAHLDTVPSRDTSVGPRPTYSLLPYAAVAVVYLVLAIEGYRVATHGIAAGGAGYSLLTLIVGAAVVTGFVVARQVVVLRRNAELMADRLAREAYFRALVKHSSDPIIVLHADGTVREASPAVGHVLGHSWEALGGRPIAELLEPDDVATARADLLGVVTGSTADGRAATPHEWRFRHTDGTPRWIEVRCTNLLADPAVHGIVINGRDITERRTLEEQLRQVQKMEALGQLTGGVAHDLNNLFTIIMSNAEMLVDDLGDQPAFRSAAEDMFGAGRRGATLVTKLLAFSRADKLNRSPLRLAPLISDISYLLRRILPVTIELRTPAQMDELTVCADRGAMEQVLINLATNARDAMPDGGVLTVDVATRVLDDEYCRVHGRGTSGPHVAITVRDTGQGMSEEVRRRMYEPFFTTKARGAGTGLGLTIAYGVMHHHDGFVEVESTLGKGTAICILLPLTAPVESVEQETIVAREAPVGATGLVLVVEDEEPIRRLTQRLLERRGYTVLSAVDGRDALRVIAKHQGKIDLVISDLMMPKMGGKELFQELRRSGTCPPFLFVSGYSEDTANDLRNAGDDIEFINKPWETRQFMACVDKMVEAGAKVPAVAA